MSSGRKVGGSAVASAVANANTPRAATAARSRTVLKMMATDGLVTLAFTVAGGDADKEKALEDMVTDQPRNCTLRSALDPASVWQSASVFLPQGIGIEC